MLLRESIKTIKLSIPLILGEFVQMLANIIDMAMVGKISYDYLAAAALAGCIISVPFIIGVGITVSLLQQISSKNGKNDINQISHFLFNGVFLCFSFALIISIVIHFGAVVVLHLNQDRTVAMLAIPYLRLLGWSLIPLLVFLALKHFIDGLQKTTMPMILSLIFLPINIFINWSLIYGHAGAPRLELLGAGIGTLITRILMLITLIVVTLVHKEFRKYFIVIKKQWNIKKKTMWQLLSIGLPIGLQLAMEISAFAVSALMVGSLGSIEQAAHQIVFNCTIFTLMLTLGLAQGCSIRISYALGQNNWNKILMIVKSTLLITLFYGLLCSIVLYIYKDKIVLLFNKNSFVVSQASSILIFGCVFLVVNALQIVSASILRGIKDVYMPTIITFLAYWIIAIPLSYILGLKMEMGVAGVWIGFIIGLSFSFLLLFLRIFKLFNKNMVRYDKISKIQFDFKGQV
jgi:multidrug resistance protein, MATE family